jgi:hypothetical protein
MRDARMAAASGTPAWPGSLDARPGLARTGLGSGLSVAGAVRPPHPRGARPRQYSTPCQAAQHRPAKRAAMRMAARIPAPRAPTGPGSLRRRRSAGAVRAARGTCRPPPVVFAEILAAPNREMGAVIPPFRPGKVSLERERLQESLAVAGIVRTPPLLVLACTGVTLDP